MQTPKVLSKFHLTLLAGSLVMLAAGCSSHREATYSTSTPTVVYGGTENGAGAVVTTPEVGQNTAQLRTDETDIGPGTPRGDATSADPSEASTQGAGSRALVGQQRSRNTGSAVSTPGGVSQGAVASANAITDVTTLSSASDQSTLVGRPVQLSGVRVQAVVGPHLVRIGNEGGQPVFVRLQQPVPGLREGDELNLTGTVRQPSQTLASSPDLGGVATHVLMQQPIYVDAQSAQLVRSR